MPNEKIGLVVMINISTGGGAQKIVCDMIRELGRLKKEVYILTPYKLDYKKIKEFYGPVKIDKVYYPSKFKKWFCKEIVLSRKLMKKEFQQMAKEVDMIIDFDGRVLDRYLPKGFDKKRYVIWRHSCLMNTDGNRSTITRRLKKLMKKIIDFEKNIPTSERLYTVDKWTKKDNLQGWGSRFKAYGTLYFPIDTRHLSYKGGKKKDQIVIFGRFSPNKSMEDSIEIFDKGTKDHPNFKLVILGGVTPDTKDYADYLKKIVKNRGLSDRTTFIFDPSFERIKEVLLESKILVDSQRDVSITLTAVESLSAGNIVLAYKNAATYQEALENGKYGFGFKNNKEGGKQLRKIIEQLKKKKLNHKQFISRADYFSYDRFGKEVKKILEEILGGGRI